MAASISTMEEDIRWSLQDELHKLIEGAMKLSFSDLKEQGPLVFSSKEEYGDYQCENVLCVWPELTEEPQDKHPDIKKPTDVGEEIKKHIEKRDDMIKQVSVHDVGIVTFRLSGKWIAESIHKMLRAGIDTWAPKVFNCEKVMISFPSWDAPEQTRLSLCRRTYTLNTLARMLEYSKVDLIMFQESSQFMNQKKVDKDKAEGKVKECFLVEERDGNVTISVGPEGERKPLFRGKKDGRFGNAYKDLSNMWYGLYTEKADWIIYMTPAQQQEYLEMCFSAARHAKWLPKDRYKSPSVNYAGYQTCCKEVEQIINFANQLKEESVESPTTVLSNALTYTFLKTHRLAVCTFNSSEMGSTLKYLLETQDQICSYTLKFREDVDDLTKASHLTLGKGNDILEEGVERVLGLHLLKFTEVLRESCLSIMPNILCKYLHDLCEEFHSCYGSCVSKEGGYVTDPTTRLLLYKATEIVIAKCFHLLGIVSDPSSSEVRIAESLLAELSAKRPMDANALEADNKKQKKVVVGGTSEDTVITRSPSPIPRDLPKNPRFEPISMLLNITSDYKFKKGKLLGQVSISDTLGLLSDEWVQSYEPDCCHVSLFNREWFESINMNNYGFLNFGNTSSRHSVAISSSMEICIRLYVSTENKDAIYELCDHQSDIDFLNFWEKDGDSTCGALMATGGDGDILMHYILLKDAVDAALELTCVSLADNLKVYGDIYAYYGSDFDHENDDKILNNFYMSLLYRDDPDSVKCGAKVPLRKSVMAVPNKGSLLIGTKLMNEFGNVILNESYEISSLTEGSNGVDIVGTCFSFHLKVEWSQGPGCSKGGKYLLQM